MVRSIRSDLEAGISLLMAARDRAYSLMTRPSSVDDERLRLQIGSLHSRLVAQATYQSPQDAEFQVFSQNGEDGIIQYLVSKIPIGTPSFVEVGVQDYSESNTRFLLVNNYWRGLIVDCGSNHLTYLRQQSIGWQRDIRGLSAFVTAANINELLGEAGFMGDMGLFSLDIDGNDYWVLQALTVIAPRIVIVEYNSIFGPAAAVTIPYDPQFQRTRAHYSNLYYGASLSALTLLMEDKGHALVGVNRAGNNAFFVRRDLLGSIREVSPRECYVASPFAEARGPDGSLTYTHDMAARVALIGHLPVYDIRRDTLVAVHSLFEDGRNAEEP
jgi:hypothetical protein